MTFHVFAIRLVMRINRQASGVILFCMYGQLGHGSGSCSPSLIPISELHGVTTVSAGEFHAVAINAQGALYAWGYNKDGQLGNGTTSNRCACLIVCSSNSQVT